MHNSQESLETLIRQLNEFIEDRYVSPGGFEPPDPIESDWPELYAAVQAVEAASPSGKLPMGAWEHWCSLLRICRASDDDSARGEAAFCEANKLMEWAVAELNNPPPKILSADRNYLGLTAISEDRCVKRDGYSDCVEFQKAHKQWTLFSMLYKAGNAGLSRDAIMKEMYPSDARTPNVLDQHKQKVERKLECLGLEIDADQRGIWRLQDLRMA